jgi:hypothetical protein
MLIIVNLFDISCLLDFLMLFLGIHQHLTVVESYFVGGGVVLCIMPLSKVFKLYPENH